MPGNAVQCGSFDISMNTGLQYCSSTPGHSENSRNNISSRNKKKDLKTIAMSFLLYYSKIAFLGQFLNFAKETQTS